MFKKLLFLLALLLSVAASAQPLGTYKENKGYSIILQGQNRYVMWMPSGRKSGTYSVDGTGIWFYPDFGKRSIGWYGISDSGYKYIDFADIYFYLEGPNGIDKEKRAKYLKEQKEEEVRKKKQEEERQRAEEERKKAEEEARKQEQIRVQKRNELVEKISAESKSTSSAIESSLTAMACEDDVWLLAIDYKCYDIGYDYNAIGNKQESEKWSNYQKMIRDIFDGVYKKISTKKLNDAGTYFQNKGEYFVASLYYERTANRGDKDSYEKLGDCYSKIGRYDKAVEWYEKIEYKSDKVTYALANIFAEGKKGVAKDESKAVELFGKIAGEYNSKYSEFYHPSALWLADYYYYKKNDIQSADVYYGRAMTEDDIYSRYMRGQCYYKKGKYNDAIDVFRYLVENKSYMPAATKLGMAYMRKPDFQSAVEMFKKAAEGGETEAMLQLSRCYMEGIGTETKTSEGMEWLQRAVDKDCVEADVELGLCYLEGKGIKKNPVAGIECLQRAADKGCAKAKVELGLCYIKGKGVKKDPLTGIGLIQAEADNGDAYAQYRLGLCYLNGMGVKKNPTESVTWLRKAADQEFAEAYYELGNIYTTGKGVPQDEGEGALMYNKAGLLGYGDAYYVLGMKYLEKNRRIAYETFMAGKKYGSIRCEKILKAQFSGYLGF